jgi:hypothetical protein
MERQGKSEEKKPSLTAKTCCWKFYYFENIRLLLTKRTRNDSFKGDSAGCGLTILLSG